MSILEVTAAIIQKDGQVLVCQRPANKSCGLLWEFPGGKIEPGETGEECIIRECQEELGITITVDKELTQVQYEYPDRCVHLHFYICNIVSGVLELKEHHAVHWIAPREILNYTFCPADAKMLRSLHYDIF